MNTTELISRVNSINIDELLKTIKVPVTASQESPITFPPLKRPLQVDNWWLTDGRDTSAVQPHISAKLAMYYSIGYQHRPYLIMALGVNYGYALMAFAKGSRAAGVPYATCNGYDDEVGRPGSLEWVRQAFLTDLVPYNLSHSNARQYDACGIPLKHIDLFHLSADANNRDTAKDLELAVPTLSPRGIIVVDKESSETLDICIAAATKHGFKITEVCGLIILDR